MRIIAGAWRGRALAAPPGQSTRPTAERVRQALFDMLMHNDWGRVALTEGTVLDAFAGTGALGLEALSRGAATAIFFEFARAALAALRANIASVRAEARCTVLVADAHRPPAGRPHSLAFLDPPYGTDMVPLVAALQAAGWIGPDTLLAVETAAADLPALGECLADRTHGPARITIWRTSA